MLTSLSGRKLNNFVLRSKLKILVVSQYFWPEFLCLNELVADLVKDGHEVVVLTGEPNYPTGIIFDDYKKEPKKFSNYYGAEIIRSKLRPRKNGSFNLILNYFSFLIYSCFTVWNKLSNRKFDIVFVFQSSPVTVAIPALFYKRISGTKVVLWVQDLWPETLSAVGVVKNKYALGLVGTLVSLIYKYCDLILCQSVSFIDNIEKYNKTNTPVEYFPNWADDVFSQSSVDLIPSYERKEGFFDVLFAGNIGEAQDFPSILNAAELLKNLNIRIIIVGDGRLTNWLKNEIHMRELSHTVILLGRFPIERMPSFFAQADVLLVSLAKKKIFSMTIPSKVQSYLAAGKPIVAMLDGIGAKVLNDAGCGITNASGEFDKLAASIILLSELERHELITMGDAGIKYYQENFNKDLLRSKLVDFFRFCISNNS